MTSPYCPCTFCSILVLGYVYSFDVVYETPFSIPPAHPESNSWPLAPNIRYKIRVQTIIMYMNSRNVTRRLYEYDLWKGILTERR